MYDVVEIQSRVTASLDGRQRGKGNHPSRPLKGTIVKYRSKVAWLGKNRSEYDLDLTY